MAEILKDREKDGCLLGFDTWDEAKVYLGADPVLSKTGAVIKQRTNPTTGTVTLKTRIIVDSKSPKSPREPNGHIARLCPGPLTPFRGLLA